MQQFESKTVITKAEKYVALSPKMVRKMVAGTLLLILLWLLIKAWIIGTAVQSMRSYRTQAESLLAAGPAQIDGDQAEALISGVRQDVLTIKSELEIFMPLLTRLEWLPKYGPTLAIAPQLLEMADAGTETAVLVSRSLKPALDILQSENLSGEDQLSALLQVVDQAEPDIQQAINSLQTVIEAQAAIDNRAAQPERVQRLLDLSSEWLPMASDGLKLLTILPEIAGINGQKSYLILAQNEDEIRATGGFISGAGVMTVDNGRLLSFSFQDAYKVDDFTKPYGDPPAALYEVMGFELFLFRDSNFWPDFPTSAQQAMLLYSYGLDLAELDGAIAFNQSFLSHLLKATGPITIPEGNITITSANVEKTLQTSWEAGAGESWRGDRKQFFGAFATAIQSKLLADFSQIDPIALIQGVTQAAAKQSLQIYMSDPAVGAVLNDINWDGRLENPAQSDYLLVVDTNVGFNKTNLFIERQLDYWVTITPALATQSTLEISYFHAGETTKNCAQQDALTPIQPTYAEISNQCFWNYVRVYTPENSTLTQSSAQPLAQNRILATEDWPGLFRAIDDLPGWAVLDNLLLIESGPSAAYQLSYQNSNLIQEVEPDVFQYSLQLGQQAGLNDETRNITVTLPEGATIVAITPEPSEVVENSIQFLDLSGMTLSISFRN